MWELDYKESWAPKNWCFWTVVLEKTLESPLECKEIQPVHPKGYQSWVFIGRTDFEAETPVLWPPDAKSWLIWKNPDVGKDWGQEEKGTTEDELIGWHHQLNGHGFGWILGVGDGQGGLACCGSWGCRVGHDWVTELNWTELINWTRDVLTKYLLLATPFPSSKLHLHPSSTSTPIEVDSSGLYQWTQPSLPCLCFSGNTGRRPEGGRRVKWQFSVPAFFWLVFMGWLCLFFKE